MRRLLFILREATRSLVRAGLAGWLAIFSLATLSAFGTAIYGVKLSIDQAESQLLSQFELEAFLKPGRDSKLPHLAEWLASREGVTGVDLVSKEQAAQRFSDQYSGEVFALLGENPLPASVIVHYDPSNVRSVWISSEAKEIGNHEDVDEVAYEGELLIRLEEMSGRLGLSLLIAAASLVFIAAFLTFQSVRVAVKSGVSWARAVRFVGGTEGQVRKPFVAAGMLAGLIGGLAGAGLTTLGQYLLSQGGMVPQPDWLVSLLMVAGVMIIGAAGASVAIRRPSRERGAP